MNFNLLTVIFILPSLITLVVMRIRMKPWAEISSVLGWRWSAPVYFLWAIVFTLIITALAIPFAFLVAPGLYLQLSPVGWPAACAIDPTASSPVCSLTAWAIPSAMCSPWRWEDEERSPKR